MVAVSAPGLPGLPGNAGARNRGQVSIYSIDATFKPERRLPFQPPARIKPDDVLFDDSKQLRFGAALARTRSYLVVGSPGKNEQHDGVVQVYKQADGRWRKAAIVRPPAAQRSWLFGSAVAATEDTLMVTSPTGRIDKRGLIGKGLVYIYRRQDNDQWFLTARVEVPSMLSAGRPIAISKDTAVIWTPSVDPESRVLVLRKRTKRWTASSSVVITHGAGAVGQTIDASGDRVILGGIFDGRRLAGLAPRGTTMAWIISQKDNQWRTEALIQSDKKISVKDLGWSVAILGDRAVAAAPNSGALFVFSANSGRWRFSHRLSATTVGRGELLGSSLVLTDRFVIAGAPHDDAKFHRAGGNLTVKNPQPCVGVAHLFFVD